MSTQQKAVEDMITIIEDYNRQDHATLVNAMFRFRADRLAGAWQIPVNATGEERDKFDDMHPIYVISHDSDRVNGALRLLPTTGPTLFNESFADSVPDGAALSHPALWECSRLCASHVVRDLFLAVADLAPRVGIETLISNVDDRMLHICRHLGFDTHILGHTDRYGERVYLTTLDVAECARALRMAAVAAEYDQPLKPPGHFNEMLRAIGDGRKIDAIKIYRQLFGIPLKDAKDAIELAMPPGKW